MAQPFLYVATPCHGGQVQIQYLNAVLRLEAACEAQGLGFHLDLLEDDRVIARARARLAHRFLQHPEATHLLFCDADIAFAPETALRMLGAGKDLVAGVCPLKRLDWEKIRKMALAGAPDLQAAALGYVLRFLPNAAHAVEVEEGFARIAYAGTGFMLIRREAVRRVVDAHPELTATLDDGERVGMVFEPMVEADTGEHLSEDYAFCRRWRDLGGEVFGDVGSRFTHVGPAAYTGSLLAALEAGAGLG
jgi:hypothetical protein